MIRDIEMNMVGKLEEEKKHVCWDKVRLYASLRGSCKCPGLAPGASPR